MREEGVNVLKSHLRISIDTQLPGGPANARDRAFYRGGSQDHPPHRAPGKFPRDGHRLARPKREVLELATLKFIDAREDALLIGPPGTGKSHAAEALAAFAVTRGYKV